MKAEIWNFERGFIKVFTSSYEIKTQIARWARAKVSCYYISRDGKKAWDFILPSKLYNRAAELLGLPMKQKNRNRVEAGKRVGRRNLPCVLAEVGNGQKPVEPRNLAESNQDTARFI